MIGSVTCGKFDGYDTIDIVITPSTYLTSEYFL
jgi:hypothetical protein